VTPLKQTGMVLGPSGSSTYSRGFLSLEPGDALLMYTDGMVEATDGRGREFGVERLKKAFLSMRDKSSHDISRALIDRVGEFTRGRPAEDDRTVVVLKRIGEGLRPTDPLPRVSDGVPRPSDGSGKPPS